MPKGRKKLFSGNGADSSAPFFHLALLFMLLVIWSQPSHALRVRISEDLVNNIGAKHGEYARRRMLRWQQLMEQNKNLSERRKLEVVNAFFNQIPFISDATHWGTIDYWATPIELLATNGGDCEDYSIAKYFTLIELGIAEEKLQIMYVKALQLNQAHMVLTYYSSPDAVPLILDNLIPDILPATKRKDLKPVYSFNAKGLWRAKQRGRGRLIGGPRRLDLWTEMLQRLKQQEKGDP